METKTEARMLRIYVSSTDKFKHGLLYETLVFAAKRYGLSGATVLKGAMGFGSSSIVRSVRFWEITEKLPVVIEIVDEAEPRNCLWSSKLWMKRIKLNYLPKKSSPGLTK
ncbi:MAG: DUF190 domain-containing protein [Bacteroidetes bacterium]|nr:DUF190 domain-containing protein [Bacteroidota bacterium]